MTVQGPVKKQQPDGMSLRGSNPPPPPRTGISEREKMKFTKGNIDLGYFWTQTFGLLGSRPPSPPPPPLSKTLPYPFGLGHVVVTEQSGA